MAEPVPSLLPYQQRWIDDKARIKVAVKGRRVGLSWAEALDAVLHAAAESGANVYYQSYSRDNAREFVDDCASWARLLEKAAAAVDETLLDDDSGGDPVQAFRVRFASGHAIHAMTSAPRQFRSRGRPGERAIVDEAAHVDHLPEVLKAAMSFTIRGGSLRVISTHNGENAFLELVEDMAAGKRPGSLHEIPFRKAVAEGMYRQVCASAGTAWSAEAEAAWVADVYRVHGRDAAEELDCEPARGGGAWLAWEDLAACRHPDAGDASLYAGGPVYVGIDVARRRNLWCLVAAELVGDVLWTREQLAERGISFAHQKSLVRGVLDRYERVVRVAVDQGGMGEPVVEDYQGAFGRHRVQGVLLQGERRLAVATALRRRVEDRRHRVPDDDDTVADLRSVRRAGGGAGALRLVAEGTGDDHADRFWAHALACDAAETRIVRYDRWRRVDNRMDRRHLEVNSGRHRDGGWRMRTRPGAYF